MEEHLKEIKILKDVGSDTNFTKLWSLFLYIQLLSHFVVNAKCVCVCAWILGGAWC
jgi:hypothetical protein